MSPLNKDGTRGPINAGVPLNQKGVRAPDSINPASNNIQSPQGNKTQLNDIKKPQNQERKLHPLQEERDRKKRENPNRDFGADEYSKTYNEKYKEYVERGFDKEGSARSAMVDAKAAADKERRGMWSEEQQQYI